MQDKQRISTLGCRTTDLNCYLAFVCGGLRNEKYGRFVDRTYAMIVTLPTLQIATDCLYISYILI